MPSMRGILISRMAKGGGVVRKPSSSLRKNPSPTQKFADSFFFDESAEGKMRGGFVDQGRLFSYISPEARIPANHPLRAIRALVRDVFAELDRSFSRLYANEGRPSIPPEQLLSALLLAGVLRHPVGTPAH